MTETDAHRAALRDVMEALKLAVAEDRCQPATAGHLASLIARLVRTQIADTDAALQPVVDALEEHSRQLATLQRAVGPPHAN